MSAADRKIAVLLFDERRLPRVMDAVKVFSDGACGEVVVFSGDPDVDAGCRVEAFPTDSKLETARRNAVLKKYDEEGFDGVLHVVSDQVQVLKEPGKFMDDLDAMMRRLDYPLWLSTVTDSMNYVYGRYNPRFLLRNDSGPMKAAGDGYGIAATSHSNTAWMAYDMKALRGQRDIMLFSEEFTVPMFYIVELLARRRANRRPGQLFFMNQYLTVDSERGAFRAASDGFGDPPAPQKTMAEEDAKFKSMNMDFKPDYSVDAVLDALAEKLTGLFPDA